MKKYGMIQIDGEIHEMLKKYCQESGYKINKLVESLIKEKVEPPKKTPPKNVLPSIRN